MSDEKNEAATSAKTDKTDKTDRTAWTGKAGGDVAVKSEVALPLPVEVAAATEETGPEAKAPVIAPNSGYAVFFFPAALEALGAAIKPYLQTGNGEPHMLCREVDTGGAFIKLTVDEESAHGKPQKVELMVPANMIRLILSVHSDGTFGFARPRTSMAY